MCNDCTDVCECLSAIRRKGSPKSDRCFATFPLCVVNNICRPRAKMPVDDYHPAIYEAGRPIPRGLKGLNEVRIDCGLPERWLDLIAAYDAWLDGGRVGQWDDVLVSEGTLEWERVNGVAFHDYHASAAGGQQGQDQAGAGEEDGDEDSEGSEVPEGPDSGDDAEMEEE